MIYSDGNEARLGDDIEIDTRYRGLVVANIDGEQFTSDYPKEQWAYLGKGIMVVTDFAGLVHYTSAEHEHMRLVSRAKF